ncbi:MAG TPA: tripartite tricarboxylate transporter TctB family protein [Candidatus Methylomirabilis sp.]|nr:tripartite tricarboxylate transporter TctB family protein [Candidatus Methylomirabilis sp.]HSC72387.1 tripartite tricarboxylate transporter TctB family protein [Candidatus Methylomirabilis sp.]
MRSRDAVGGVAMLLFGVLTAVLSLQFPLGSLHRPGSGFFPLTLGLTLMGLAACHLWQVRRAAPVPALQAVAQESQGSVSRVLLFLGAIALATALLGVLGYPVVAFLLMVAMLVILGIGRWRDSLLIALGAAVAAYVLFVQWLKIPLPKGWIGL